MGLPETPVAGAVFANDRGDDVVDGRALASGHAGTERQGGDQHRGDAPEREAGREGS